MLPYRRRLPTKTVEYKETMEDTMDKNPEEDVASNVKQIGKEFVLSVHQINLHTTDGHM